MKIDLAAAFLDIGLRSGFFGRARFGIGERQMLSVPSVALVQRGQLVGVYVVDQDGLAHMRLVKTGKEHGDRVEVLAGLQVGDEVVIDDIETLRDGMPVKKQGLELASR